MKKTGTCPKCGSSNIVDSDKIMGDKAMYHRWVCLECTYAELYCTEKQTAELKKLKEKGKL
ncbi:MAG: hypothetical protein FWD37_05180 [Methanomassiliicoccaceae archaeon]|nr:hypothetical protein [Methanomassiliicoccaceae archaeon]